MKRSGYIALFVLLIVFSLSFIVLAQPSPETTNPEADVSQIQGLVTQIPINEQGEIDPGTVIGLKSKAEVRIQAINTWLATNASWLKAILGMVPEISWLFAINLYIWLFCLVYLFLNGTVFGVIIQNKNYARLAGGVLFVILIVTKIAYNLSILITNLLDIIWNKIIPYGILATVILIVILIVILVVIAVYFPQAMVIINKWLVERKHQKKIKGGEEAAGELKETAKGIEEGRKIGKS
jgi:hypothetical protein